MAPTPASCRIWSSRRCSISPRTPAVEAGNPKSRSDWGELARALGVKVIHIAERDTQASNVPKKPNEFVNTWSVEGFVSEGAQPSELGWGTHEKNFPRDGKRHDFGCLAAIYLMQPGAATRVRTWTPHGRAFPRLLHHAWRIDLDRRLLDGARGRAGGLSSDGPLRLSPERLGRRVGARVRRPQLGAAGRDAHSHGRHHLRHRRARRAARRATRRMRTGSARSCRSRKRASSRPTTARPACRSRSRASRE